MSASTLRNAAILALCTATLGLLSLLPGYTPESTATPLYAVRSVHACDTCHIEPSGWKNPDTKSRRCSLDCSTCHVSPTGGGMRNPSGRYYGLQTLPMWGPGPGDDTDPSKYLPEGHPAEGRYRLGEGFSGWWPGELDSTQLEDRYGELEPDPTFRTGFDGRFMSYSTFGEHGDWLLFPMQASLYLMGRPQQKKTVLYADAGLKSSRSGLNLLGQDVDMGATGDALDYLRVRELFVMIDRLPYKSYVRAGRFNPPFGWRLPDHTGFTRRALGFDQDRQVFGVEAGWNPNYPYANVALFREGLDAWPGDTGLPGWGVAATAGVRELAWHAGGSAMALTRDNGSGEILVGPLYGLNLYPVALIGELDLRHSTPATDSSASARQGLYALQQVDWLVVKGLNGKAKLDWRDTDLASADTMTWRATLGAEWHPVAHAHTELNYYRQYDGAVLFSEGLIWYLHGWY